MRVRHAADQAAARALISRAIPFCVDGNVADLSEMVGGCDLFDVLDDGGRPVGAFAAQVISYSDGKTIAFTAAGGLPGHDIAGAIAAWADAQAAGIGAVATTCTTKRRGLVRRLQKEGYEVAGYVMRKERVKNGQ